MKKLLYLTLFLLAAVDVFAQKQVFVADDIDHFWTAYNRIHQEKDSIKQYQLLRDLYLNKATPGLQGLLEVRRYSEKEFIDAMTQFPQFWASIRPNTLKVKTLYPKINANIQKLQKAYPGFKPATIYFSMGAFRTNGTVQGNKILIGSEMALADKTTAVFEFPVWRQSFYKNQNPWAELPLLCTHEYIHTQQKALVENLLSSCLYEGVAEFLSCKVTGEQSATPAIAFGKANQQEVVNQFVRDLYVMTNDYNWLWGENRNHLKIRDLGYYIGYEICERYYNVSKDKALAVKSLIELDYTNETEVARLVDASKVLPKPLRELEQDYESQRPMVVSVEPFENGSTNLRPGMTRITVHFSEALSTSNTGLDFGPLGQQHCPAIKPERSFSPDGKSWTFEADLKPNQHYQILISNNFRKPDGVRLKPYLLDFKTGN